MTIYEIAKKSGLSTATISRALDPEMRHKVALSTLKKIDAMVQKFGYSVNSAARNLRKSSFHTIGVAIPHVQNAFMIDYYSKTLSGVSDYLLDSDYAMKVISLKPDYSTKFHGEIGKAEGIDGLVVTPWWATFFSRTLVMERLGIPCVIISEPPRKIKGHSVSGDNVLGGQIAAEYLHKKGHRKILILAGPKDFMDSCSRVRGFQDYFSKTHSAYKLTVIHADFQKTIALDFMRQFLAKKVDVSALFCCNDEMAFGAIQAMRERGIHCPKDLSVIGFDDDTRAEYFEPALTTIRMPFYAMAKEAARCLIQKIKGVEEGAHFYNDQTVFPVELVERDSVRDRR